jgi:hypothetical protein
MILFPNRRNLPATDKSFGRWRLSLSAAVAVLVALGTAPRTVACACGCGIFEVGTSSMLPEGSGGTASVEFDYQDQNHNWSGTSEAPASDNTDKDIRTSFLTFAYQDMFSRGWGIRFDLPFEVRHFETVSYAPGNPIATLNFSGFGDVRIQGVYTGLSADMSTGLTFGLKLPSGSYTTNNVYGDIDRDTEIGSGSTDLLLGGFQRFNLGTDYGWSGFLEGQLDVPVLIQSQYRPGAEFDVAFGAYYSGWHIGQILVSPIAQVKVSIRGRDTGANATYPVASGYSRLLVSPGIEFDLHPFKVYADVERPVYQRFNGDQVAAPALYKLEVSYMF